MAFATDSPAVLRRQQKKGPTGLAEPSAALSGNRGLLDFSAERRGNRL